MRTLLLERMPSTDQGVQGFMTFGHFTLCTVERPWVPVDEHLGGRNFRSCVPAGNYRLIQHVRTNGDVVVALENPLLNVYYKEDDVPDSGGRWKILIHSGNWVKDVVGCIAPGLSKNNASDTPMVTMSRAAVAEIMDFITGDEAELEIRWIR
jgi:hypothetical protein